MSRMGATLRVVVHRAAPGASALAELAYEPGALGVPGEVSADMWISAKDPEALAATLRGELEKSGGAQVLFPELPGRYHVRVAGPELEQLERLVTAGAAALARCPDTTEVRPAQQGAVPALKLEIDREAAARLGVQTREVTQLYKAAAAGVPAGALEQGVRRIPVVLRVGEARPLDPESLLSLQVRGAQGVLPLSALVRLTTGTEYASIHRTDRQRDAALHFAAGRDGLQCAQEALRSLQLPVGYFLELPLPDR